MLMRKIFVSAAILAVAVLGGLTLTGRVSALPNCNGQIPAVDKNACAARACNRNCTTAVGSLGNPNRCTSVGAVPSDLCLNNGGLVDCTETYVCFVDPFTGMCVMGSATGVNTINTANAINTGCTQE